MTSGAGSGIAIGAGDALIVADLQNDFLPGGALGVERGDEIVPVLVRYVGRFRARGLPVFLTRDWHPPDHCSFRARGGPWPVHCVAGSPGAAPPPGFPVPPDARIVHKATSPDKEAYSAFQGTELERELRAVGARRIFVGGLATDYCVLETVRDGRRLGFDVFLLTDAVRAVDVRAGDGARAEEEMIRLGARPARLEDLAA
jgi:nicotinamidase/pyrazinamidase